MALNENGEIVRSEFVVEGRKQPLVEIRERTSKSQEKYMQQRCDDEYDKTTSETLIRCLKAINKYHEDENVQLMQNRPKDIERTRHLKVWHDLSTIANHSHLVFMVSSLYDPAIHYLYREYENLTGCKNRHSNKEKNSLAKAPKPFQKLKKDELIRELNARGIYEGESKKELDKILTEELHSVQRVPAFALQQPNSYPGIHQLLTKKESAAVKVINCSIGGKDTKRTFDYRCALIILAKRSSKNVTSNIVQQLLTTLRGVWFQAKGTMCKLYGNYYHNITSHAAMQHRLINGKACNVEEQEQIFNTITNITKSTSSYHPSHIIGNIFIRLQAEKQMQAFQGSSSLNQETSVSKLADSLLPYGNTIISGDIIKKHIRSWQSHLERISDFLLPGKGS
ncbi:Hypothetical predicted protein [Paramuricea clavata]|uniref:Uncharacterized protein n=1 Tax=Paramuricea clavata TaxID=317549 RepID=A0A6S7HB41_PARCT|nr:Hypothetical predicted protein [Paramuricea clavata]